MLYYLRGLQWELSWVVWVLLLTSLTSVNGATLHSIGDPTPSEQLYLELINRSRANPPAEGIRLRDISDPAIRSAYTFFGVNTTLMASQFASIPAVPPLAMNARLLTAARNHSSYQLSIGQQTHSGLGGTDAGARMTANGYAWSSWGENIYAYSVSVQEGHAAFNVDWGSGTGGMQTPPGHRNNIHSPNFREVGLGMALGRNGSVGPQIITQDFGRQLVQTPFITGVVYRDSNGNNFYDPGEGVGGVTVTVSGSLFYAETASAGGYSVPVTTNGSYLVTFSGPSVPTTQQTAVVISQRNVKVDYVPGAPSLSLQITGIRSSSPTQVEILFTATGGSITAARLFRSTSFTGPYQADNSAILENIGPSQYRLRTSTTGSGRWFYRVVSP